MDVVFSQIGLIATLVERFVQFVKPVYQVRFEQYQKQIDTGLAFAGNIFLCYSWQVDVFTGAGFAFNPVFGQVLTGVFASLGSVVIHELVAILLEFRKGLPRVA